MSRAPGERAAARLVYLYGFVDTEGAAASAALEGVAGVDPDAAVRSVAEGGIAAVVSDVAEEEFSDEALRRRLNDLTSLETLARGHARVLDALVRSVTVLPARLATLYASEFEVRRLLAEQRSDLTDALRRLEGVREWGVKVFVQRPRLLQRLGEEGGYGAGSSPAPERSRGAAYLAERQREQALEQRLRHEVLVRVEEVHEALRSLATQFRLVGTHADLPGEDPGELALNAAYLVRREHEDELRSVVAGFAARLDERGFHVVATGPWPAYNFLEAPLP